MTDISLFSPVIFRQTHNYLMSIMPCLSAKPKNAAGNNLFAPLVACGISAVLR
jgi:hypothetical protein